MNAEAQANNVGPSAPSAVGLRVRISHFPEITNPTVERLEHTTLDEFIRALKPRRFPLAELRRDESDPRKWKKPKTLGVYAFAEFRSARRTASNVVAVDVLTIEYDGACSIDDAGRVWEGRSGVAFTTFNSTADDPRVRVHLEVSRSMTPGEYARMWAWAATHSSRAGFEVDPVPKDASRAWYDVAAPDGALFQRRALRGDVLDVDGILAAAPSVAPPQTSPDRGRQAGDAAEGIYAGSRNATLTALAGRLRRVGFDSPEIDAALEACNQHRCQPPLPREEIATIAKSIGRKDGGTIETLSAPRGVREILHELARSGPPRRLSTGLAPLDEATGGGLPLGSILVIVGAPSAGKTALAQHLIDRAFEDGLPCVYLAADEPPDAIAARFAQRGGLTMFDDATAVEEVVSKTPDATVVDSGYAVESAMQLLKDPGVLVVDSAQTARSSDSGRAGDPRARVEAIVSACNVARSRGHLVVLLSEAARAFYRSRRRDEQIDGMAAGRETSAIEYGADVLLSLRNQRGSTATMVEIAKARLRGGRRGAVFALEVNTETTRVATVVPDCEDSSTSRDAKMMREVAAKHPGAHTGHLRSVFKGQLGGQCGEDRFRAACADAGLINRGKGNRAAWYAPEDSEDTNEPTT